MMKWINISMGRLKTAYLDKKAMAICFSFQRNQINRDCSNEVHSLQSLQSQSNQTI